MYFRIIVTAVEVAATNAAVHAEISFFDQIVAFELKLLNLVWVFEVAQFFLLL
jgi:hypothetical protein